MENYRNMVENTQDYLKGRKTKELMDLVRMPPKADLMTHLRMVYGHVDWDDLIFKLDEDTISRILKNQDGICEGEDVLVRMKKGVHVAIVNNNGLGPVTYKEMIADEVAFEIYDLDEAIDQAAKWFISDLLDSVFSFSLFTPYFLIAFRLALLEGEIEDEERFAEERLEEVWRKTFSSVMYFAGKTLQKESIELGKSCHRMSFNLPEYQVEDYLEAMSDEK